MKLNKSIVSGHVIICFDNVINGLLTVVMAPIFFAAANDGIVQLLASYASYAALFFTGPFGAAFFGRMGDRFGRRKALLTTIMGVGVPVFLIGILPTYAKIGLIAPIALILLRMTQGLFKGAEYAGVLIHNHETGGKCTSCSSSIIAMGCFGGSIAALVCWFITQEGTPSWAWRIPYIIGGLSAFIVFFLRRRIGETDEFVGILEKEKVSKTPVRDLFKNHRFATIVSIAIAACYNSMAYSAMIFGNRLFQQAGYPISDSMIYSLLDLLWIAIAIKIMGHVAPKITMERQIKYGILALGLAALPVALLISGELNLVKIYSYMIIVSFLSATVISCSATYISNLFPVSCRYSGFAITDSIGAVLGGSTPFMMLYFSSIFDTNLGCVVWFYILTIPAFILTSIMNKKIKNGEIGEAAFNNNCSI